MEYIADHSVWGILKTYIYQVRVLHSGTCNIVTEGRPIGIGIIYNISPTLVIRAVRYPAALDKLTEGARGSLE